MFTLDVLNKRFHITCRTQEFSFSLGLKDYWEGLNIVKFIKSKSLIITTTSENGINQA